ncbi:hypothetical protein [Limosilactobacillus sp.]|uniref:hypothetical protein n=1 Tax=Limosilactobacillus sp. TaxID=2773925 RepID=UPI003F0189D2
MAQDLEDLLKTTMRNFENAEKQYFESDDNTDQTLLKIRKANYDNATNNLNLVKQMAGKKQLTQQKTRETPQSEKPAIKVTTSSQPHSKANSESQPESAEKQPEIKLNFPDYEEIQAAKEEKQPEIKISTSSVLREAAKQAFIGGSKKKSDKTTDKTKKPAKKAQSASKDSSTMTREQYRKLHSKK